MNAILAIVALTLIAVLAALISMRVSLRRRRRQESEPDLDSDLDFDLDLDHDAEDEIESPLCIVDPALPDLQDQAKARLLALPQFRRQVDGSLVDLYQGARLLSCDCAQLPYHHLVLDTGGREGIALGSERALEQYVAVQEAVATMLNGGRVNLLSRAPSTGPAQPPTQEGL